MIRAGDRGHVHVVRDGVTEGRRRLDGQRTGARRGHRSCWTDRGLTVAVEIGGRDVVRPAAIEPPVLAMLAETTVGGAMAVPLTWGGPALQRKTMKSCSRNTAPKPSGRLRRGGSFASPSCGTEAAVRLVLTLLCYLPMARVTTSSALSPKAAATRTPRLARKLEPSPCVIGNPVVDVVNDFLTTELAFVHCLGGCVGRSALQRRSRTRAARPAAESYHTRVRCQMTNFMARRSVRTSSTA